MLSLEYFQEVFELIIWIHAQHLNDALHQVWLHLTFQPKRFDRLPGVDAMLRTAQLLSASLEHTFLLFLDALKTLLFMKRFLTKYYIVALIMTE